MEVVRQLCDKMEADLTVEYGLYIHAIGAPYGMLLQVRWEYYTSPSTG